ncbi:hypothetical protein ABPG72_011534 [Tetrahymena utriculariae]
MDDINFSKRQLILSIVAVALVAIVILALIIVTSVFWIPLLLVTSPILIILGLLVKFTNLGSPFQQAYFKAYDWVFYKSERPRKFMWSLIYNTMCLLYPSTQWKAMNYGYAVLSGNGHLIQNLQKEDEDERFCLQLYHYVATQFGTVKNLSGLRVLEVGSGRGGGLNYISKYLNPQECFGVDFSENQIRFCRHHYSSNKKLQFFKGDSQALDQIPEIQESTFDVAVNVESSHCYGNFDQFVQQINRALKPGGFFCFTDFRTDLECQQLDTYFKSLPYFEVVRKEDITVNVLQSLKQDEKRRSSLIEGNVSKFLKPFFRKFSGLKGTRIYQELEEKKTLYVAYVLQKKL